MNASQPIKHRILPALAFGIRQKMVLMLVCVLTLALGTTAWLTIHDQQQQVLRATTEHGQDLSRIVSQALSYSVISYDYHTIQLLLDEITKARDIGYAKVLSNEGNVMAESGHPPTQENQWQMFESDIQFSGKSAGRLIIGLNLDQVAETLKNEQSSILSRQVITIFLIAFGEFIALSYLIIRPVTIIYRALTNRVERDGQISYNIPIVSKDEFGMLSQQFNDMGTQLNQANARLQERITSADQKLTETNARLVQQAEELKHINEELSRIAITDPLTGLFNRRYFENLLEGDMALSERYGDSNSIVMVDVDRFKLINDVHGHSSGDTVLRDLSGVLTTTIRKSDVACRLGGEEFVILCRRISKEQSLAVADKIRKAIESTSFHSIDGKLIPVTVSIGIETFPKDGKITPLMENLNRADMALYASKAAGRNCVTHYSDIPKSTKDD